MKKSKRTLPNKELSTEREGMKGWNLMWAKHATRKTPWSMLNLDRFFVLDGVLQFFDIEIGLSGCLVGKFDCLLGVICRSHYIECKPKSQSNVDSRKQFQSILYVLLLAKFLSLFPYFKLINY